MDWILKLLKKIHHISVVQLGEGWNEKLVWEIH